MTAATDSAPGEFSRCILLCVSTGHKPSLSLTDVRTGAVISLPGPAVPFHTIRRQHECFLMMIWQWNVRGTAAARPGQGQPPERHRKDRPAGQHATHSQIWQSFSTRHDHIFLRSVSHCAHVSGSMLNVCTYAGSADDQKDDVSEVMASLNLSKKGL